MIYLSFGLFLCQLLWIGFVSCAVYHIIPSPTHHCPAESCLTLTSFAVNASFYLDKNTSLIFLPGNHTMHSKFNVSGPGVLNFSMMSVANQSRAGINCENNSKPGFTFNAVNHVHVSNLKFFECYNDKYYQYKLITLTASSLVLVKCIFEDNVGTGLITAANSSITIAQNTFKNNYVEIHFGMLTFIYCNITIICSTFISNDGPTLLTVNRGYNSGVGSTIAIASTLTIIITGCEFRNNHRSTDNIYVDHIINVRNFEVLSIYDTKFISNKVAILYARESVINTDNCTFKYNHGSAMDLTDCKVNIFNSVFNNNEASALILWNSTTHIHGSEFKENVEIRSYTIARGGAIYSLSETLVSFSEVCIFADNQADQGGAIYLGYSAQLFITRGATVIIANNTASADGGGIYLKDHSNLILHSQSILQILENKATENGGGIYACRLSSINLGFKSLNNISPTSNSTIYFYNNRARLGGGLYLNSIVYAFPCLNNIVNFDENSADYGGAVYAADHESTSQYYHFDPECFFQSEIFHNPAKNYTISSDNIKCNNKGKPFHFSLNRAKYSGFSLYKDAFNNCSMGRKSFEEFKLLGIISNVQTSDVGFSLVQVCFCENSNPDCTKEMPFNDIKTGEKLVINVAIADKGNHIVNGSIVSEIRGSVLVRDDQKIQDVINGCTRLIFNIYSFEVSQRLIISPQLKRSRHITMESSKRSIKLIFLACIDCPIGFQKIVDDTKGCDCVCHITLGLYIITCNYSRETVTKKDTPAWISYLSVKNTSDYLIYPYCPMDYCLPPDITVEINLNNYDGADTQCAHNRSGLLCGTCTPGLSLSLGSSRCLPCQTHWPGVFIAIIITSLLAGIFLVASLLMLNLTVAFGTLDGLIFYANIVAANQHKFFPSTSFVTVFVSWLNLELGIDTCFFDGMDFYWKTWIQLTFPAYVLLLVVLLIIISEHSVKFAEMVAKRNPVATLNTLILLSYVKFLRAIILVFSFATLDYPDSSYPVVWWPDATVGYFSGKHVVLWITAAMILVGGIFYTAILFSWQWLLYYQHKRIFKWIIQNQRLCMFVEPNHAPYAFKHRYWAGLLLLVRVVVYTISAADVSSDRMITLLAIGIIILFLTILICSFRPYKYLPIQILEVTCYANIVCLCFATFYVSKAGKSQDVITYISGTTSLVFLLAVLTYHGITQLFLPTELGKKLNNKLFQRFSDVETEEQVNLVVQDNNKDEPVTYSEVDPPTRGEGPPQSHFDSPRSRRDTINNISKSADYEANELRPIEQKVIDSPAPYILMK